MSFELYLVALVLTLAVLYLVVPFAARAYLRFRGKRVITCPETRKPAAVVLWPMSSRYCGQGKHSHR